MGGAAAHRAGAGAGGAVFSLALWTLRRRKAGSAGAFVALCGASVLLTAFGIVLRSGIGGGVPAQRYAAADVLVAGPRSFSVTEGDSTKTEQLTGPAPVPAGLVRRVDGVEGVRRAVGAVRFPAELVDGDGHRVRGAGDRRSEGANWASAALGSYERSGRAPAAPDEVVVEESLARAAGVRVGDTVRIAATDDVARRTVVGTVRHTGAGGTLRSPPVFFADATARALSGREGRFDAVGVLAARGVPPGELAARIADRLDGERAEVHTGDGRGTVEHRDVTAARHQLRELAGSLGGTVVLITMLVVGGTLALGVQQRRRELALLRALGATPRQIHRLIAGEALILAVTASALGWLPGIAAAQVLRRALAATGTLPSDFAFSAGPLPMVAALVVGVLTAQVPAFAVARRAAAVPPVEALGTAESPEPGTGRARTCWGLLLFVLGAAASLLPLFSGSVFAVAGAGSGGLVMVVSVLVLAPSLVGGVIRVAGLPLRRLLGTPGLLALANSRYHARRTAAGAGPLVLALGFAALQLFIPATVSAAAVAQARAGGLADWTVTVPGAGVPRDVLRRAERLPGVTAVAGTVRAEVFGSRELLDSAEVFPYQAQGVTRGALGRLLDPGTVHGDPERLRPGTVVLSSQAAATLGVRTGDRARLHLPDGTRARPRVVAVHRRGAGFGDVLLPAATLLRHGAGPLYDSVLVRGAPRSGTSHGGTAQTRAELERLAARYPGAEVREGGAAPAGQEHTALASLLDSALPLVPVLGYIAVSVGNTLVMSTLARGREFALLRLLGATRRQVRRMLLTEVALLALAAVVLGTLVPLLPLSTVALGLTGTPVPYIPPLLHLGLAALASAPAAAAVLLPAGHTLRGPLRPGSALR